MLWLVVILQMISTNIVGISIVDTIARNITVTAMMAAIMMR